MWMVTPVWTSLVREVAGYRYCGFFLSLQVRLPMKDDTHNNPRRSRLCIGSFIVGWEIAKSLQFLVGTDRSRSGRES
jgi:hypothetical protein